VASRLSYCPCPRSRPARSAAAAGSRAPPSREQHGRDGICRPVLGSLLPGRRRSCAHSPCISAVGCAWLIHDARSPSRTVFARPARRSLANLHGSCFLGAGPLILGGSRRSGGIPRTTRRRWHLCEEAPRVAVGRGPACLSRPMRLGSGLIREDSLRRRLQPLRHEWAPIRPDCGTGRSPARSLPVWGSRVGLRRISDLRENDRASCGRCPRVPGIATTRLAWGLTDVVVMLLRSWTRNGPPPPMPRPSQPAYCDGCRRRTMWRRGLWRLRRRIGSCDGFPNGSVAADAGGRARLDGKVMAMSPDADWPLLRQAELVRPRRLRARS